MKLNKLIKERINEELRDITKNQNPGGFYIDQYYNNLEPLRLVDLIFSLNQFINNNDIKFYINIPVKANRKYEKVFLEFTTIKNNLFKLLSTNEAKLILYSQSLQEISYEKQVDNYYKEKINSFFSNVFLPENLLVEYIEYKDAFGEYDRNVIIRLL